MIRANLIDIPCLTDDLEIERNGTRRAIPSASWSHHDLRELAVAEAKELRGQKKSAVRYWFLGTALALLRRDFAWGEWYAWLRTSEIDRSRAQRAQLLAQVFELPDELEGLSITSATALATKRLGRTAAPTPSQRRLLNRLRALKSKTLPGIRTCLEEIASPESFLPELHEAAELLQEICESVQRIEHPRPKP